MAINSLSTGFRPGVCTSSTRPTAPYEGQQIYETDTDKLLVWNGSAWKQIPSAATAGAVLQVVYGSTASQITSASTTPVDTGLTATITPQSASNKVLVCVEQNGLLKVTNDTWLTLNTFRGSTNIGNIGAQIAVTGSAATNGVGGSGIQILDEPATTSATTYKTSFFSGNNSATVAVQHAGARSTIILMEISA
jgi:hypothetical protein